MELKTGYKQTEVGVIPSDWSVTQVKELGEVKRGAGSQYTTYTGESNGIRFIRINDFFENNPVFVDPTSHMMRFAIHQDDILFAGTGNTAGASFIPLNEWVGLPHSYNAPRIRVNNKINKQFLLYCLQSEYLLRQQKGLFVGAAQPFLDTKAIAHFDIALPSTLAEQTAIATALSDTDQYISHLEKLIAKKRNIKQGAMQELLKPKEGWVVKRLGEIGIVIRGASPRPQGDTRFYGGTVPRLMVEDVTRDGKFVTPKVDFLTEEGAKRSRPCKAGTLTIVCSGTVGIPSILAVDACIHDGFLALVKIKREYSSDYLYHQLIVLREKFEQSATHGGVFTNLTTSILKEFEITFPSENEQTRIATILSDMDAEITILETKLSKAQSIKQGMMQQLLTGKIRLV